MSGGWTLKAKIGVPDGYVSGIVAVVIVTAKLSEQRLTLMMILMVMVSDGGRQES